MKKEAGNRQGEKMKSNDTKDLIIGVDVGQNSIRVILADKDAKILGRNIIPASGLSARVIGSDSLDIIHELVKKYKVTRDRIMAIGVGIENDKYLPIGKRIEKEFHAGTVVEESSVCAAFGEKLLNPAASINNLLYIYSSLGRGVLLDPRGQPDGRSKYLSAWNEALGIARLAKSEVARGVGTTIVDLAKGQVDNITEEVVIKAARQNDEVASGIIHSVGLNLGLRIAYLVNLYKPGAVMVCGGVEKAGNLVLDPIEKTVKKWASADLADKIKIVSGVLGEDAVSLGAAMLASKKAR